MVDTMIDATISQHGSWAEEYDGQPLSKAERRHLRSAWRLDYAGPNKRLGQIHAISSQELPSETMPDSMLKTIMKYRIQDVFFPDDHGLRCTWGKDIHFINAKKEGSLHTKLYNVGPAKLMHVPFVPLGLKFANRKSHTKAKQLLQHESERGRTYSRVNLLDLSEDILLMILDLLVSSNGEKVEPNMITTNWRHRWQLPSMNRGNLVTTQIHKTKASDRFGTYKIWQLVKRPLIDATVLRTWKYIHYLGTPILYGNKFNFECGHPDQDWSPPSMIFDSERFHQAQDHYIKGDHGDNNKHRIAKESYLEFRPNPYPPHHDDSKSKARIFHTMNLAERQVGLKYLPGWVVYDPFLRFLYTIGPRNATHIHKVRFHGSIDMATQPVFGSNYSEFDLLQCLKIYKTFWGQLTPNLTQLTIEAFLSNVAGIVGLDRHLMENENGRVDPLRAFLTTEVLSVESLMLLEIEASANHEKEPYYHDIIKAVATRTDHKLNVKCILDSGNTIHNVQEFRLATQERCAHCKRAERSDFPHAKWCTAAFRASRRVCKICRKMGSHTEKCQQAFEARRSKRLQRIETRS